MIGVDTNVLVRFVVDDPTEPDQCAMARALISSADGPGQVFISLTTVVEFCWVLRSSYGFSRTETLTVLRDIVEAQEFVIENSGQVAQALDESERESKDFPDVLIAISGRDIGCDVTYTFDKKASSLPGMRLLINA